MGKPPTGYPQFLGLRWAYNLQTQQVLSVDIYDRDSALWYSLDKFKTYKACNQRVSSGCYLVDKRLTLLSDRPITQFVTLYYVMTGGDLPGDAHIPRQHILDLERETFLSLLGEEKTQLRIRHLLETGKPLRN